MPDFTVDPFTQVYNALWDLLTADAGFTALVKQNNRISLQGDNADPVRTNVQDNDTPEVIIRPTGGPANLTKTNTSAEIIEEYEVMVATAP
jgi:hypothetical protein